MAPSTKTMRATSIGLGKKSIISAAQKKNAKCYPAPNRYRITSQFEELRHGTMRGGKTFGIHHKYYDRVYYPSNVAKALETEKGLPGPGHYKIRTESKYLR